MILYSLVCTDCRETFDGWFAGAAAFDDQVERGEVVCPFCAGLSIEKAIMAPRVAQAGSEKRAKTQAKKTVMTAQHAEEALLALRRKVEENCDYVGERFADEARKIHNGESEARGIYGESTAEEHDALKDEGISVHRIPWIERKPH